MKTYLRLVRAQMRSQAQYRTSFAFDLMANVGFGIVDLFNVLVMFAVTDTLGGFDFRAALLIAGLGGTSFALADLFVGNIDTMADYIRTGRLDALLVRPLSALGQLVAMDFSARRVGRVVISLGVLSVAAARAQVHWTPARAVLLAIAPLAGALLFCAVFVGTATVSFWWIDAGQFGNGFTYGGRDFSMYPTTVYSGLLQ
jgi:ABC-2 type transport system permease protein